MADRNLTIDRKTPASQSTFDLAGLRQGDELVVYTTRGGHASQITWRITHSPETSATAHKVSNLLVGTDHPTYLQQKAKLSGETHLATLARLLKPNMDMVVDGFTVGQVLRIDLNPYGK